MPQLRPADHWFRRAAAALACLALCLPAPAQQDPPPQEGHPAGSRAPSGEHYTDLSGLSLEELLDVEVSLVSRRAERLLDAPASVFVITRLDIERSGLHSIPELLRLVPGVQVQRIDARRYAISARGFAGQFANKLLVLMDGRSIYTPLFSGTWWDMQDLVLDDIERIEVIRGPGGVNWGANAVNGVINVVTRKAADTHGSYVQSIASTDERSVLSVRHGGSLGDCVDYRLSGKFRQLDSSRDAAGRTAGDGGSDGLLDFRIDGRPGPQRSWLLRGGLLLLDEDATVRTPLPGPPYAQDVVEATRGVAGHLLGRLEQRDDDGGSYSVQAFYDGIDREEGGLFRERRNTFDLDLQYALPPLGDHALTVGAGYRLTADSVDTGPTIGAADPHAVHDLVSAFARDEVWLCRDRLRFDLGLKYEHNDFTGSELQPEARLWWQPAADTLLWGSVGRAVRTPSRAEHTGSIDYRAGPGPGGSTLLVQIQPDPGLAAEELWAYELGARSQLRDDLVADLSLFVHDYDDLIGYIPGTPTGSGSPLLLPAVSANTFAVRNYGLEASLTWQASEALRLVGGYAFLEQDVLHSDPAALAPTGFGEHPRHQALLRASLDLPQHWLFDAEAFYVDRLRSGGAAAYTRLDLRLAWNPDANTQLSIGVQNLLDDRHPEADFELGAVPTEVERAFYLQFHHHF